jgi:dihydroorotase
MKTLLKGGRVVDPANGIDGVCDVLLDGERIARVGRDLPVEGATVIEIPRDLVVCPGFIDMHVHLREPGQEHKETVATGTAAAVAGGFTAVACMPNTSPVNDSANVTSLILAKAAEANLARVYPIGAVSKGSKGELLADIAELKSSGCVAITDDGHPVATAMLMRRAMEYAGMFDLPVIEHCEDPSLKADGVAHEGYRASTLGLRGIPGAAEALGVERGILLSELTGSAFHVAHMSARQSIRAVRKGKEAGVRVTCEVAPHHFTLTDDLLAAPIPYDTNAKMNPPLREAADRDAMLAGIADGTVDVIATDHAPHHYDEKKVEFDRAPFGIIGLETAIPLALDRLVHAGLIRLPRLVDLMSVNPARILRVPGGSLAEGSRADVTILAPELKVRVDAQKMRSRSKNTPFDGWELRGGVAATIVGGRLLYGNESFGSFDRSIRSDRWSVRSVRTFNSCEPLE